MKKMAGMIIRLVVLGTILTLYGCEKLDEETYKQPVKTIDAGNVNKLAGVDTDNIELIAFPRTVRIGNTWIDNESDTIAYEEKYFGSWDKMSDKVKAVFITTDVIKNYYDKKMKCKDGVYTFKINNLDVTLTKDHISATNKIFGEIYHEDDIGCIVRENDMLVETQFLSGLLCIGTNGLRRLDQDDEYMVKGEVALFPNEFGNIYVNELQEKDCTYYIGKRIDKPKGCEKIDVSIRGYYIYKTQDGSYLLEANDKFFEILEDDTQFAEDIDQEPNNLAGSESEGLTSETDKAVSQGAEDTDSGPSGDVINEHDEKVSSGMEERYRSILLNGEDFVNIDIADHHRKLNLQNIREAVSGDDGIKAEVTKFSIVDLDGNGEDELVLGIRVN